MVILYSNITKEKKSSLLLSLARHIGITFVKHEIKILYTSPNPFFEGLKGMEEGMFEGRDEVLDAIRNVEKVLFYFSNV